MAPLNATRRTAGEAPPPASASAAALPGRQELEGMRAHLRGVRLPQGPDEWLAMKRKRDQTRGGVPPHLWMIHGELYDLEPYLNRHPGGRVWLDLTRGTDCSDAFEVHHIDEALVQPILRKYRVAPAPATPVHPESVRAYIWAEDGFYKTVKRRVCAALKPEGGWGPTLQMHLLCALAVTLWAAAFALLCWHPSAAAAVLAGLALYPLFGVGHNFFHQRDGLPWRYAWDLTLFSSHQWRIMHALSHHLYPNLDMDIEASQVEPWANFMRNQPTNHWLVLLSHSVFALLCGPMDFVRRTIEIVVLGHRLRPESLLPLAQLALLTACAGLWPALGYWLLMHGCAQYLFILFSTLVHRTEYGWTEGCDSVLPPSEDFGIHTVQSTQDYNVDSGLAVTLFGFASFNDHIAHHLFPTLDLSRQPRVRQILLDTCREFGVKYQPHSVNDLVPSLFKTLLRKRGDLGYKPAPAVPPPSSQKKTT